MNYRTVNYLNNKDLLRNILLSKASFTWYIDGDYRKSRYLDYDLIVCGGQELYEESRNKYILQKINTALRLKDKKKVYRIEDKYLSLLSEEDWIDIDNKIILFDGKLTEHIIEHAKFGRINRLRYANGQKRVSTFDDIRDEMDNMPNEDIVLRVHTFEHIPEDEERKSSKKKVADAHIELNFQPYKHYAYHDGKFQCVAISHMDKNGEFSTRCGKINYQLASAFITLCRRYASRHNWRGYSYVDDMQGQALCQLSNVGLQFNELFSNNPFSYYTTGIKNAFTVTFNEEKRSQEIRDRILMMNNQNPSWTKQLETEISRDEHWDKVLDNNNMDAGEVTVHDEIDEIDELDDFDCPDDLISELEQELEEAEEAEEAEENRN